MGQRILKILALAGFVFLGLILMIFILDWFGTGTGIFIIVLMLGACVLFIRYLISSGKIFRSPPKGQSPKPQIRKQGRPLGSMLGGAGGFTKSGAMVVDKEDSGLPTFEDVAGLKEAKESLQEVVEILKTPEKFQKIGARTPKGVLLMGPPGTGKTLLARATAGEADVGFVSIGGSEFVEVYVGVGAFRVRGLFNDARKEAAKKGGAIIFIDEIDAVGKTRGTGISGGGQDEREQTLNQIFKEMDGFEKDTNIIVMAATNRPDVLDPALIRPGRFDRKIIVDLPDIKGRCEILEIHTKNKRLAKGVDLNELARETPGFSGAGLENLANEAALLAARKNKNRIEMKDFEEAIDIVTFGPQRKSRLISKTEREITAFHESGHALVASLLPEVEPPQKISIIPSGMGIGGYTKFLPEEDRYLYTKSYLFSKLKVLLGGRVAEEIIFGEEQVSTGAEDDLKKATELTWRVVCDFGMSELGRITYGKKEENPFLPGEAHRQKTYSDQTAEEIDKEIKRILDGSYQEARELIEENRSKLDALAKKLFSKQELTGEEILKITDQRVISKKAAL